jgi:glycosyltransferase involved in cell wall biosynthesis
MAEALARRGLAVQGLTSTVFEHGQDVDVGAWLRERGFRFEICGRDSWSLDARGLRSGESIHYWLSVRGVSLALHPSPIAGPHEPDDVEREEFLRLFDEALEGFRPDVLVNYGGDLLAQEVRARARAQGISVIFALHNFNYHSSSPFVNVEAVIVPSRFAADHYRKSLGLDCTVLPCLVDARRARVESRDPRYMAFVNPSLEKGVYPFARIADEMGQRRPDIPILVVESRGSEATLVDCGIDLRAHGNVFLMGNTPDPRDFWGVTKVCLLPSLWWENQPLVAVEAMLNGIPVIGSDRGGIPETLGDSGVVLPLPERLTQFTRELPTPEEVAPWVEAVIRLWDDADWYAEHSRRASAESRRWDPEVLEPQYVRFFSEIKSKAKS